MCPKRPRIDLSFRTAASPRVYDEHHFSLGSSPSLLSRSPLACISIITLAGIIRVDVTKARITGEMRKATDEGTAENHGE